MHVVNYDETTVDPEQGETGDDKKVRFEYEGTVSLYSGSDEGWINYLFALADCETLGLHDPQVDSRTTERVRTT